MVFASFLFLFWFLPAFLPIYFALPIRWRNLWITLGSLAFYGWWRPHYLGLMLLSIAIDYGAARAMGEPGTSRHRRALLWISIVSNLGLLAWFKYANLLAATWNDVAPWPIAWDEVLLPVGISFFTFQSMSYTIDVYRGEVKPVRSFLDLLCFVSLFPQLVAGPIVRFRDVESDLHARQTSFVGFTDGVMLFAIGFVKKVLIADRVAPIADSVFGQGDPGFVTSWIGAVAYAVQIYFDFSGYSDMAVGLGRMLGFHFPENFASPYRAHSITEFWRRWHISLSTWLRDYLYVPLGGNRLGSGRTYVNLVVTMLLGGLWHGAQWTFLLWGGWQALWLVLERVRGKAVPYDFLPRPLQVLLTFVVVVFGWVLFRGHGVGEVMTMWSGMVGGHGFGWLPAMGQQQGIAYSALVLGVVVAFALPRSEMLVRRFHPLVMLFVFVAFVAAIGQLLASDFVPFLYFQF
jgi:alginate O-acetyltransferase complex protein AlgI